MKVLKVVIGLCLFFGILGISGCSFAYESSPITSEITVKHTDSIFDVTPNLKGGLSGFKGGASGSGSTRGMPWTMGLIIFALMVVVFAPIFIWSYLKQKRGKK